MTLWEIYKELELLAHVHGWDTPVRTGYFVGGDEVGSIGYLEDRKCIAIE